jgi:hypothetical protein
LAEAIRERDQLASAASAAQEAASRARQVVSDAEARLAKAERAIEVARERHADKVTQAVAQGAKLPAPGIRQARIEEAEARDALEASRDAQARLQQAQAAAEQELRSANSKCLEVAKGVVASEVTAWPTEMKALIEMFQGKVAAFSWMVRSGVIQDYDPALNQLLHHDPMMRHGSLAVELLRSLGVNGWAPTWTNDLDRLPSVQEWRAVLDRLQVDAGTPIPTGRTLRGGP